LSEKAFLHDFAGDLPPEEARILYAVQQPFNKSLTSEKTTNAAWRTKPSFYAVSTQDRTINPDLERFMAALAHIIAVASPSYLKGRIPPADPSGLASFDGIVMRSSKTRRVRERPMRNAAGDEMTVPLKPTIAFDDPEAMCQAAVLGMGVTQIIVAHALRHLESGALVRLVPLWYADAGPISIYYASRRRVPAKTRVFIDFIAEAFRRQRLAGSIG